MKTSIVGLDETCSINSGATTPGVFAHPHPPAFTTNSLLDANSPANADDTNFAGNADAASVSAASFDTVDVVSVKNMNNSSNAPSKMSNSTPPGFKIQAQGKDEGVSLVSENISDFDAVDSVFIRNGGGGETGSGGGGGDLSKNVRLVDAFVHGIDLRFPKDLDFLCMCEVFDKTAAKTVREKLSRHFPYIVYDIAAR